MLGQNRKRGDSSARLQGKLLRRYQEHLGKVRGLAADTIWRHLTYSRAMLNHFGIRAKCPVHAMDARTDRRVCVARGTLRPIERPECWLVCAIFLRFLLQDGLIRRDLAAAVPTVARWRLASLPTTLRQDEINRLIGAADLHTPLGRRDYAIVLCISELGLRDRTWRTWKSAASTSQPVCCGSGNAKSGRRQSFR